MKNFSKKLVCTALAICMCASMAVTAVTAAAAQTPSEAFAASQAIAERDMAARVNVDLINGQWVGSPGSWRWQYNNGTYATSVWGKEDGLWYYFDASGYAMTGWQKIDGYWYYFHPSNCYAHTGWQPIGGKWYYFHPSNAYAYTGWQPIDGKWYYFDPVNADMKTGWLPDGGYWYFLGPSGDMWTGERFITGSNRSYFFDNNGRMASWTYPTPGVTNLSSPHNENRSGTRHKGIDIPAGAGTPILAPANGTVTDAGVRPSTRTPGDGLGSMGYFVKLNSTTIDPSGTPVHIRMMHMQSHPLVSRYETITAGTKIGFVGNTGDSYGAHLHMDTSNTTSDPPSIDRCYNPASFFETTLTAGGAPVYELTFGANSLNGADPWPYNENYYTIVIELIDYVGVEEFEIWAAEETEKNPRLSEWFSIVSFTEHFGITEEQFRQLVPEGYYTEAEINAIFGRENISVFAN